jgi:hypothetical protein
MEKFLRNHQEADKRTAFTEIIINAAPEKVRQKFLAFEQWNEWNKTIPKITVKAGNVDDISSKPTLELELDLNRSGKPSKVPASPIVTVNDINAFKWGLNNGFIIKAEHVFLFEPINSGTATRLIHYERMSGLLSPLFMTSKLVAQMVDGYNKMNEDLKQLVEQ